MIENNSVVSFSEVSKKIDRFQLEHISFTVERGTITSLVGANGAGKTSIFQLLLGLLHPDRGSISLFGKGNIQQKKEACFAFVPEHPVGYEMLTPKEIAAFYANWYTSWDQQQFEKRLQDYEIEENKAFHHLSQGNQKKLAFILALASNPSLLILDEPTNGLDVFSKKQMLEDIAVFMQTEDNTVFLATHQMDEVKKLVDFLIVLHKGKLIGKLEKDQLLYEWRKVYVPAVPEKLKACKDTIVLDKHHQFFITKHFSRAKTMLMEKKVPLIKAESLELDDILSLLLSKNASLLERTHSLK